MTFVGTAFFFNPDISQRNMHFLPTLSELPLNILPPWHGRTPAKGSDESFGGQSHNGLPEVNKHEYKHDIIICCQFIFPF